MWLSAGAGEGMVMPQADEAYWATVSEKERPLRAEVGRVLLELTGRMNRKGRVQDIVHPAGRCVEHSCAAVRRC